MGDELDGTRLLAPLRDVPLPTATTDVSRAVRAGRRRERVRRAATGAGIAAVVGLVTVTAVSLLGPATPPVPPTATPSASPSAAPLLAVPGTLDLSRRMVDVSNAVAPAVPVHFDLYPDRQVLDLQSPGESAGHPTRITLFAPGKLPRNPRGGGGDWKPESGTPASPVGGRPARWMAQGAPSWLAWQYADNAWVTVEVPAYAELKKSGGPAAMQFAMTEAVRIANGVTTDRSIPVRFPFTTTLPAFTGVTSVSGTVDGSEVSASFDIPGITPDVDVTVVTGLRPGQNEEAPAVNTTVDGYQAGAVGPSPKSILVVYDVRDGYSIRISLVAEWPSGTDGLIALYRECHLVADPTNRDTWLATPLG